MTVGSHPGRWPGLEGAAMKPCPIVMIRLFDFSQDSEGQPVAHHEVISRTKKTKETLFKTKRRHQVGHGRILYGYVPYAFDKAKINGSEYRKYHTYWDRDSEEIWLFYRRRFAG